MQANVGWKSKVVACRLQTGYSTCRSSPRVATDMRLSRRTTKSAGICVCHLKKVMHRGWAYFQARLAFTMAAFNVLVQWHGFQPNASGFVPLSIAEFSL